jgi:hypothetical protein
VPSLPTFIGRYGLPRGRLRDKLAGVRRHIEWLERTIHPRRSWWVTGVPRRCLQVAFALLIVLLALPVPFDNLLPAWAILFFCLALIEGDGVMAMLGWLFTLFTAAWTVFLAIIGHAAIMIAIATFRQVVFD